MSRHFVWPVRVYYEDTDLAGVVYYANYLRFMERARTEWLRSLGLDQSALLEDENIVFVVVSAELKFRKPARFDDKLEVTARVVSHKRASMEFAQKIWRDCVGEDLLCEGHIRAATIDATSLKPKRMPQKILRGLA